MFLRTLGGLELEGAGIQRPELLLLVCRLALDGPQERAHLAELFWRDAADPRNQLPADRPQERLTALAVVPVRWRRLHPEHRPGRADEGVALATDRTNGRPFAYPSPIKNDSRSLGAKGREK